MRFHDSLVGSVLLLLALAVLWSLRSFPEPIGQPYGAALFPGLIAGGLAVCALLLIVQGLRAARTPWVELGAGLRLPRKRLGFVLVLGTLVFYILCAELLGFVLCAIVMLTVLLWAFAVSPRWILPIATLATLVVHTAFYQWLKVPLPWGILQRWAW